MDFSTVWGEFETPLFLFIKDRVPAREAAEDILQEVAVKLNTAMRSGEVKNHKAWLFQVARNTIADYFRKEAAYQRRVEPAFVETAVEGELAGCVCDLAEFVIRNYLPAKYAEALLLSDIEKVPQKEVATRMNLSLSATKSRVQRARKLLKAQIEECVEIDYKPDGGVAGYTLKEGCELPPELLREIERVNLSL